MPLLDPFKVRADFPMLQQQMHGKPFVYLDSAATAQKPQCVIDALMRFYSTQYATVHRAIYEFASQSTEHYNLARQTVQKFLGAAHSEEIVFTKGTTEAINLVASSFSRAFIKPGDEILISEMEHHANLIPWQFVCQERGAHLKFIPIDDKGQLILGEYAKLLTEKTKIVSVAHIANSTGTLNPVAQMIEMAHKKGAKVLIDGAQSAPHMPVDVQKLDADFFVFSGHKTFGPTGIGVLYGKRELLEEMPPYQGGGDMVEKVTLQHATYQPSPLKFEAGTPMIAEVIGLQEALRYMEKLGRENIAAWGHLLLEYATAKLLEIKNLRIIGTAERKGPIISFVVQGIHPLDIGTLLDLRGIAVRTGTQCAQPTMLRFGISATTRASFAPYNTYEDIDIFVEALKEVLFTLSR